MAHTPQTQYLAVVNPAAGGGRCGSRAKAIVQQLSDAGLKVDVAETAAAGDGTRIVRDAYASGCRNFIAVGGDGTGFEVVNGLFPQAPDAKDRVSLGFLPLGTGNSFLRDFTEDGVNYSINALIEGRHRPCDVIRLTHRDGVLHYINILSLGFVAEVGALTNRRFKRFGQLGYVMGVVSKVVGLKQSAFPMCIDEGHVDNSPMTFVSFNNSRFTGGNMMMAPEADTADGKVNVIRVGEMGRFSLLRTFPKIFKGTHVDHPATQSSKVDSIEFDLQDEVDIMIDGEVMRVLPKRLDVLPSALDVRV